MTIYIYFEKCMKDSILERPRLCSFNTHILTNTMKVYLSRSILQQNFLILV